MVREIIRIIVFWLITWTIYNYALFWEIIYLLAAGRPQVAYKFFIDIYCLGLFYFVKFAYSQFLSFKDILLKIMIVGYLFTINGAALWLWWRKQTVFRAFLLATAGIYAGPVFAIFSHISMRNFMFLLYAPLFCFLGLLFFNMYYKEWWPNLDFSKFLTWRRPSSYSDNKTADD